MNNTFYLFCIIILFSCKNDYTPKPWGYPRLDLPIQSTQLFKSDCPYNFLKPNYCDLNFKYKNECWFDIEFKDYNAKVHMSYKKINNNLNIYTEDCRLLAYKHAQVAEAISEQVFINDSSQVYGMVYTFNGKTATPLQFYISDSLNHFVRGALYFNTPQSDSISPISNFIKNDIYRIIESWEWK